MSKGKELAKNTVIIAIGKISTQFISFFLLPLYTAILTPKQYGIVDLFHTGIALCLPMITLQIEQAVFRYLVEARDKVDEKNEIITLSTYFVLFECVVYSILFLVIQNFIYIDYKWYIILNVMANAFSVMLLQTARGLGNMIAYSVGSFVCAISTIVLNIVLLVFARLGVAGMLLATFLGNIFSCIYLFFSLKIWKYIQVKSVHTNKFRLMLKYSIPLVPHALSWWIVNTSDRVIISIFLGVSANGMIAVAHKFPSIFTTAFNIFSLSWAEAGALHLKGKDGPAFFERTLQMVFKVFLSIFLIVVASMPLIFHILVDGKYSQAYNQIPIFMLSALFSILVGLYNVVYTTYFATKEIMKTTIFAGLLNIVIIFMSIHFIGIYAASIAATISYGSMAIYRYYDSRKYVILRLESRIMLSGLVMTLAVFLAYYIRNIFLCGLTIAVVTIYSCFINRIILKKLFLWLASYQRSRRRI